MPSKLPYVLECKSTYPFFETIAAFDCEAAARAYGQKCSEASPEYTYRVSKHAKVLVNYSAGVPAYGQAA